MAAIALVVLNWNGRTLLEQFLPSLVAYSKMATIYVVDNNSSDDSIHFVNNHFPTIKIIKNKDNYGYAGGYNKALEQIQEPIYCLINSDIEVTENWLNPILDLFSNKKEVSIVQPKILDYKVKDKFEYAGAAGGFIDNYGFAYCRGRIFDTIEKDLEQYNDVTPIFWASGACFFIRREVFHELNGFDEDFFAHQEEIDLCWRAQNLSHSVYYCGLSEVYHVGGATLEYQNPRKTYLNFRNSLFMLLKNLPQKKMYQILFLRLCLDGIAGVKFMLQGKPKHTLSIIQAHFGFYQKSLKFYKKRGSSQNEIYYHSKNVVFQYFIKKRKFFNDIF